MPASSTPDGSLRIPSAPDAELLLAYKTAQVEWVRARLGLQLGPNSVAARAHHDRADATLLAVRRSARFPVEAIFDSLRLDGYARAALAIVVAPFLDNTVCDALREVTREPGRAHADAALVAKLLCATTADRIRQGERFAPDNLLVRAGLLEREPYDGAKAAAWLRVPLIPTVRLLGLLDGRIVFDRRLAHWARLSPARGDEAAGVVHDAELEQQVHLVRAGAGPILITGPRGAGKTRLAMALAARTGQAFVVCAEGALLPPTAGELQQALIALGREAHALGARLVIRDADSLEPAALAATVRALPDPTILLAAQERLELRASATLAFAVQPPDVALRRRAWDHALRARGLAMSTDDVLGMASRYPLARQGVERAIDVAQGQGTPSRPSLEAAAATQVQCQLAQFAELGRSRARLADLVLTPDLLEQVHEVLNAVRVRPRVLAEQGFARKLHPNRGIVAMFNGPSGAGKTFTAGVIANELGLPLYRIDVSSIVDRYVGETEKNLARVFEAAAGSNAVLLFDEADSLFGKRIENTRDAVDRHANMQVNLLLNLIEDYPGFAILTTNLKGGIDTAFLRRITYKLTFGAPTRSERRELWRGLLDTAPCGADVRLEDLAEYEISGGEIKNAVLRAAFLAGGEHPITAAVLQRAVLAEMDASGKVVQLHARRTAARI